MRLRATIKHVSGDSKNLSVMVGSRRGVVTMPDPVALRILPDGSGFSLLRIDAAGVSVAHTWHPTLEDAKDKAGSDYGIGPSDWDDEASTPSR